MSYIVACPIVFILFYGRDCQGGVFKVMENVYFFYIFISCGPFPQVFRQIKEFLMLELHKILRVSHVGSEALQIL